MPRKTSKAVEQDYLRADHDRWRLLVRNSGFRTDLADYLNKCGPNLSPERRTSPVLSRRLLKKFERLQKQFLVPWGIERVPDPALWQEPDLLLTPEGLERWYEAARQERADFATRPFYPVCMSSIRRGSRPDEWFIEYRIDTSLPIDGQLSLMEGALRSWYWKHIGVHPRGKPPSLDFHLKVFDLYHSKDDEKQRSFLGIARKLRRMPSTVRDAYFAARRKIGISPHHKVSAAESVPHPGEVSQCTNSQCRNAKTEEDFCAAHRAYLVQDQGSQRDLLVRSLSAIEQAKVRNTSGRKHFRSAD